jgi:hypothetical protein
VKTPALADACVHAPARAASVEFATRLSKSRFRMRSFLFTAVLGLACTTAVHAQDVQKTFSAKGATQAQACDAAEKQARDWVKAGKSEGRARQLLDDGNCTCTGTDGAQSCTFAVRTSDVQREEEEEG